MRKDPRPTDPMTFEAAAALDADVHPGEIAQGVWIPMTRGTWRHGEVVLNVGMVLKVWARQQGGFMVAVADPGTRLAQSPDVLRGPDVGVLREARRPTGRGVAGWLNGAPDLAVEVAGDTQSVSQLTAKALEYLQAGGLLVWLVDPDAQLVLVFTPGNVVAVKHADDLLDGATVLPGFSCRVAELFT